MDSGNFRENVDRIVMDHINTLNAFEGGSLHEYKSMEDEEQKILFNKIEEERNNVLNNINININERNDPHNDLNTIVADILATRNIKRNML